MLNSLPNKIQLCFKLHLKFFSAQSHKSWFSLSTCLCKEFLRSLKAAAQGCLSPRPHCYWWATATFTLLEYPNTQHKQLQDLFGLIAQPIQYIAMGRHDDPSCLGCGGRSLQHTFSHGSEKRDCSGWKQGQTHHSDPLSPSRPPKSNATSWRLSIQTHGLVGDVWHSNLVLTASRAVGSTVLLFPARVLPFSCSHKI